MTKEQRALRRLQKREEARGRFTQLRSPNRDRVRRLIAKQAPYVLLENGSRLTLIEAADDMSQCVMITHKRREVGVQHVSLVIQVLKQLGHTIVSFSDKDWPAKVYFK